MGFKCWYRHDRLRLSIRTVPRAKRERELNLGSSVVLVLKNTYCHMLLDNFFNSPTLIQKLHDNGLYDLCIACSDRINMPQMKKDKEMKQGDYQCNF